jgi:hypothetical protein
MMFKNRAREGLYLAEPNSFPIAPGNTGCLNAGTHRQEFHFLPSRIKVASPATAHLLVVGLKTHSAQFPWYGLK